MNKVIYKYTFSILQTVTIKMPRGARIVHTGEQSGSVCMWAEVDTDAATESRVFVVYGTGQTINPAHNYVGTVFIGPFVWHIYEVGALQS